MRRSAYTKNILQAIGVNAGEDGALIVTTKAPTKGQQPAKTFETAVYSKTTTNRK